MFGEADGGRATIGDVDVLYHDGLYHLFHLVLPNHDFIAHAVSTNGINWRRVNNALFIGDPGSWDDLMLWTMHVTPDPHRHGHWRMFYTGLSRRDQGRVQRIGLATSDDLFHWEKAAVNWQSALGRRDPEPIKRARETAAARGRVGCLHAPSDPDSCFPIEADPEHYESTVDEGRGIVSFRDPYFGQEDGQGYLLVSARSNQGPIVRRGCVCLLEEVAPNHFRCRPPLYHPGLYDDVEVPNLIRIDGEYYLIGSIREDAKIRYWHTDRLDHPWRSYHDNVLMAQGNYAGRVCRDDHGWLIWNFFSVDHTDRLTHNLMPAPKRLKRTSDGLLRASTFEEFDRWVTQPIDTRCMHTLKPEAGEDRCGIDGSAIELESAAGFQAFVFDEPLEHFRMTASLRLRGKGKCGLIFRIDGDTHDGYYLSLDMHKGIAQLRSWKTGPPMSGEQMMQFENLQSGYWHVERSGEADVQLLAFGSYLEFSIDGRVVLSLADQTFVEGLLGVYLETAHLELSNVLVRRMKSPFQSDEHLVTG